VPVAPDSRRVSRATSANKRRTAEYTPRHDVSVADAVPIRRRSAAALTPAFVTQRARVRRGHARLRRPGGVRVASRFTPASPRDDRADRRHGHTPAPRPQQASQRAPRGPTAFAEALASADPAIKGSGSADLSGSAARAAAAGGGGRRLGRLANDRNAPHIPTRWGTGAGVGELPRPRSFLDALRESATRRWRDTAARVLAISGSLAPRRIWPAVRACWRRPRSLRTRLGSPSEGSGPCARAESSDARALADQGDVAATGDRPLDLERAVFGCGWRRG
jgi:hypothetical protein